MRKTLARNKVLAYFAQLPQCLIGMEACGGAHYWARQLTKFGHTVKLIAAQFVIPYRRRGSDLRGGGSTEHAVRGSEN